jgi:anti-sigma B factor antagonist
VTPLRDPLPAAAFAIERHRDAESTVLMLSGELDLGSAPQLEHQLADAEAGPPLIVIDLAHLEFIDGAGLRVLLHGQQHADSNGHSLTLRNIPLQAERLFKVAGAADAFLTE